MAGELPLDLGKSVAEPGKCRRGVRPCELQAEFVTFAGERQRLPVDRKETSYRNPVRVEPGARD